MAASDSSADRLVVATWNINSIRSRLPLVERFVAAYAPDVLLLQETRCPDAQFPTSGLDKLGYPHVVVNGRKGHHGVAIAAKRPITDVMRENLADIDEGRHIAGAVEVGGRKVVLHSLYIPSGGDEPDPAVNPKFAAKLAYLEAFAPWSRTAAAVPSLVGGDFNVAPLPEDVWSHKQLLKVISHTPEETERLDAAQNAGSWVDVVRRDLPPPEKVFTWWSYRNRDHTVSNRGRRLDHMWASPSLADRVSGIRVVPEARSWEKPSDHVPVLVTISG
ncbi:exodeoxyribonuclease III [Amorphus orientalis]|uniref:Exodeoxyribonuclease-3 n=1 Tax=Amorphus orientalis TaxID=649198 RepID=A0AAE3VLE6_9HYPH|nr:exodeoxyribonuclease III [Amorphus orientalis]MDQ0314664.1 exodeoxyribonuclease-3 [Amorphus orientalis]